MKKPKPELVDADNPEWTREMFAKARLARDVFPELSAQSERRKRGKQRAPTKALVSLRVERAVLAAYRATGRGWQSRMNEALRRDAKRLRKAATH
jgi:uncharacterized protein (DUF4415 family)